MDQDNNNNTQKPAAASVLFSNRLEKRTQLNQKKRGKSKQTNVKKETFLAELDKLPHNERVKRAALVGRDLAGSQNVKDLVQDLRKVCWNPN